MSIYIYGISSIIISILIIIHHYCIHKNDKKKLIEKIIQIDDINNHETFAFGFLMFGLGILLGANFK